MSTLMIAWIVFCVFCFAAGLVWSRRRARRRLQARMEQAVDQEIRQQIHQEVLRHLHEGPAAAPGKAER